MLTPRGRAGRVGHSPIARPRARCGIIAPGSPTGGRPMLSEYIRAGMRKARYEVFDDGHVLRNDRGLSRPVGQRGYPRILPRGVAQRIRGLDPLLPAGWCGTPAHRWYGLERGQERLMPRFGPTSRRDLIAALRKTGFTGPRQGGKHAFMLKNGIRVIIPNPHRSEFGCCLPSCGKQG